MNDPTPTSPEPTHPAMQHDPRGALGRDVNGVWYPAGRDLRFWWACYRKVAHLTEDDARALNDEFGGTTVPYQCPFCDQWHNGRPGQTRGIPDMSRLRKQWRNRTDKPSLEELRTALLEATGAPAPGPRPANCPTPGS